MKQIFLFLLLLSGISRPALYGQTACDTLLCKDGRRIHAQILGSESGGILYTPCGDNTGRQFFIEKGKVQTIHFQNKSEKITPPPETGKNTLLNRSTPKNYSDKTTVVIWVGVSFADALHYDTEGEAVSAFQFGSQVNLKNSPFQLGMMYRPLSYYSGYFDAFDKQGISGELTFFLKKQTIGRLSGKTQKGYWGCDFQTGRRAYSYEDTYNGSTTRNFVKTNWYSLMPRIGFQLGWDIFCLDIALPIGFKSTKNSFSNGINDSKYRDTLISVQPALSFGIRI